ncbi:peptidase C39 [Clostridia bacterium]|nr:peptidase C39 [Clostridia bacterium]
MQYQITEYDCGPTSLLNGLRFLFEREEIPPDIPKYVMAYCLDAYSSKGESGKNGTSQMAMQFLAGWLNHFAKHKKFNISTKYLVGPQVSVKPNSEIIGALQQGGAAVVRVRYEGWHYVLLTQAEEDAVRLFDPYLRKRPFRHAGIEILQGKEACSNRRVRFDVLNADQRTLYALGETATREAVLLFNTATRRTQESTIEYFL